MARKIKIRNQERLGRPTYRRPRAKGVGETQEGWSLLMGGLETNCEALRIGTDECEKFVRKRVGRRCNDEFGKWLDDNKLGDIDKGDRSRLLSIMENLAEVKVWRAKLEDAKRVQLNHPSSVWRAWTCKGRGNRGQEKDEEDHEEEEEEDEKSKKKKERKQINWQHQLLMRARKALDGATQGDWLLSEPPEPGTILVAQQAAEAWASLVKRLSDEVKKHKPASKQNGEAPRAEAA